MQNVYCVVCIKDMLCNICSEPEDVRIIEKSEAFKKPGYHLYIQEFRYCVVAILPIFLYMDKMYNCTAQ